jgi:hypothetical protein
MRLLFAISLVCFCALFWAVLAAARRLRFRREPAGEPHAQRPMREIFESGDVRAPRSSRLVRNLVQQVAQPRSRNSHTSLPHEETLLEQGSWSARENVLDAQAEKPTKEPLQLAAFPRPAALKSAAPVRPSEPIFVERRKAPQSVRPAGIEHRADWALYNNKDLGDLTDPYTQLLGSATGTGSSSLNRS